MIRRYVRGEASFEERKLVTDWAASDPQHFKELEQERRLYLALTWHLPEVKTSVADTSAPRGRLISWRRVARIALQAAAVIVVGCLVGTLLYTRRIDALTEQTLAIQTPATSYIQ